MQLDILWHSEVRVYVSRKLASNCNEMCLPFSVTLRTTDSAAQGGFSLFSGARNDEECRVAAALQTPDTTVEYSGRDPHSSPAPVFINSRSCIKAQGLSLQPPTLPPTALKNRPGFSYLCRSSMWKNVGQNGTKRLLRADVDPRNNP